MERVRALPLVPLTVATALATAVCAWSTGPVAAPAATDLRPVSHQDHQGPTVSEKPGQTSDGVPGLRVEDAPPGFHSRLATGSMRVRNEVAYEIAPGITVREWDQVDGRQPVGQVRLNLVSVDLDAPGITVDNLGPRYVPNRKPVSTFAQMHDALVAVNGDFFDISDTGAPLGVGVTREKGLVGGGRTGWIPENSSLWFNRLGPRMGPLSVRWAVRQFPRVPVSGINQPTVPVGMVGVYTHRWGRTAGTSVTDGHKAAREVVVRRGRVVSNRWGVSRNRRIRPDEKVLVGVGPRGNARLKPLRRGKKVTFTRRLVGGRARMAITGDRPLLVDGVRRVVNDRLAHPRTAVGIDRDGRRLLLLVVDGRSSDSRGYTMVELADMMTSLGAEDALNLDGGGSSTMWSRKADGSMGVINTPSDGVERRVPNALGVIYTGTLGPVVAPTAP